LALSSSMTFHTVAVTFSPGEWEYLAAPQQELYQEVMLENYGYLTSLELVISKPHVIYQVEREEGPWKPKGNIPRTGNKIH
uniref:KRAB domain-containing protein n=1 Tax=Sarcophilus harrisii TaxID=9305 RepID=A0A7N4V4W8_SARHA